MTAAAAFLIASDLRSQVCPVHCAILTRDATAAPLVSLTLSIVNAGAAVNTERRSRSMRELCEPSRWSTNFIHDFEEPSGRLPAADLHDAGCRYRGGESGQRMAGVEPGGTAA